jgi:hypothetical protein
MPFSFQELNEGGRVMTSVIVWILGVFNGKIVYFASLV